MKSKIYLLLIVALLFQLKIDPVFGLPDTTYVFTYDASGNRTQRAIGSLKSAVIQASTSENTNKDFIEAELANLDIKIYPNPTKGILEVEIPNIGETKPMLIIFNSQGKQILIHPISNQTSTVNLSDQPPGTYILKLILDQESLNWKIIKD